MTNEAHIRIDEGIKRGPRYKHKPPKHPGVMSQGLTQIPEDLNPDTVLERYLTEETTSQIAVEYGISRKTLVRWLIKERPEQWKQVQIVRALCRKEQGNEGIEYACDALSLARAREMLRSGQWDLERLDSNNYGQKQEVTVKAEFSIDTVLDGHCSRLLDKLAAHAQPVQLIDVTPQPIESSKDDA